MAAFFSKKTDKSCAWCKYGVKSDYSADIFCKKCGVVGTDNVCRRYKYDPLKRTPYTQTISKEYTAEDFSL